MRTWILTGETKSEKTAGHFLRDLGFQLIEAGVEIHLMRMSSDAAKALLAERGIEVGLVVDPFDRAVASTASAREQPQHATMTQATEKTSTPPPRTQRQSASRFGEERLS